MAMIEELRKKVLGNYPKIRTTIKGTDRILNIVESVDSLIAAARAEGYREGCIEKDAEWRRGYNQGWEERKAFDQPGGALPTVLAPTEPEVKR